ncbi:prophage antirepressor [Ferrimonas balearica DSM 9799]|uniref:Prophage antirepressor n=2 Tax=Ferrimonas balearica TaxID=44012 RepID=E1SVI5_FERBD|nr:prophage antirepressor [Ferrimonas balearica DSM 9799]
MFDLNDIHRAFGLPEKKRPSEWNNAVSKHFSNSGKLRNKVGRYGGSWATQDALYAYDMWCDVEFYAAVVSAFTALANGEVEEAIEHVTSVTCVHTERAKELYAMGAKGGFAMRKALEQLFNFNTASIRVIPDFKDGQPYFVAKDVAEALGFDRPSNALKCHTTDAVVVTKRDLSLESGPRYQELSASLFQGIGQYRIALIPESDLYRLVMRSNLPSAQDFQDWVCKTVLPAIRKDGAYVMGEEKVATGEMSEESKEPYQG